MWDRVTLKQRAKEELKISYWHSLGVSTVANTIPDIIEYVLKLVLGIASLASVYDIYNSINSIRYDMYNFGNGINSLAISCITLFVASVLSVGKNLYYINATKNDRDFNYLFLPFTSGKFITIVKTMFMVGLRIFLWSLLFLIPGIIKSYEYRMVPYIIAENPDMSAEEAMSISSAMTANDKFNIFVLDLSFFGWRLLATIIPVPMVGNAFLSPYIDATDAQLYEALKYKINISFD